MSKSALFVLGGWEGHEPQQCAAIFAPRLREAGYSVDLVDTLDVYLDAARLQAVDLIAQVWTMAALTAEQELVRDALMLSHHGGRHVSRQVARSTLISFLQSSLCFFFSIE